MRPEESRCLLASYCICGPLHHPTETPLPGGDSKHDLQLLSGLPAHPSSPRPSLESLLLQGTQASRESLWPCDQGSCRT